MTVAGILALVVPGNVGGEALVGVTAPPVA
jgi:hypothetical protein